MLRAFLNPEMDEDFFYKNIKTAFLLFDEIIVWQPIEYKLKRHGFNPEEFIALLDPIRIGGKKCIPIRPAGRELFFDKLYRKGDKDNDKRQDSDWFIEQIADRALIAPYATRQESIIAANSLWDSVDTAEEWRSNAEQIYLNMRVPEKSDIALRMDRNADERHIGVVKANFQEFLMDTHAIRYLSQNYRFPSVKLLADQDHWKAYSLIDSTEKPRFKAEQYLKSAISLDKIDYISTNPNIKLFFDVFFNANNISLSDLISFKQKHYRHVVEFLASMKNSILTGSLVYDSLLKKKGIFEQISNSTETLVNYAKLSIKVAGRINPQLHAAHIDLGDFSSMSIKFAGDYLDAGLFNNTLVRLGGFPLDIRKYFIKSQINMVKVIKAYRESSSDPSFPLLIDSVGFERDFLRYELNKISGSEYVDSLNGN